VELPFSLFVYLRQFQLHIHLASSLHDDCTYKILFVDMLFRFHLIPAEANTIIAAIADAVIAVKVNMPDDLLLLLSHCTH
jgi:hypothetical protein